MKLTHLSHAVKSALICGASVMLAACGGGSDELTQNLTQHTKNTPPTASHVVIKGDAIVAGNLTAEFTYTDADKDAEGAHQYQWFSDNTAISGETSKTLTIANELQGKAVHVAITPIASQGVTTGKAVNSQSVTINSFPVAKNAVINGKPEVGSTLNATFTYSDADKDAQGNTQYQWLRAGKAITGATKQSYTLLPDDAGQTISVSVTPVAKTGSLVGAVITATPITITAIQDPDVQTGTPGFNPKDPLLSVDQWYIENTGDAPEQWGQYRNLEKGADLNIKPVWQQGITGNNVVVTVVDDGVDFSHSELAPQELKNDQGTSFSLDLLAGLNNSTPAHYSDDHGTGVAGVIAAAANNDGLVGIAPTVKLVGIRALSGDHKKQDVTADENIKDQKVQQVILDSQAQSQVSNHSYGAQDNGMLYTVSTEDYKLYKALAENGGQNGKGHVTVFAAGNGRNNTLRVVDMADINDNLQPGQMTQISLGDYAGYDITQQLPYVISVSCFSAQMHEVSYCEDGPGTLVAGASGDSDVLANAQSDKAATANIATTGASTHFYRENINTDKGYQTHRGEEHPEPKGYNLAFNGTSAAAPTVTGVVALMRSANPEMTWRDVRWALAKTARKIQKDGVYLDHTDNTKPSSNALPYWSAQGNAQFGNYSHLFGYGAVDAEAAINYVKASDFVSLPAQKTCEITLNNIAAKQAIVPTSGHNCPTTIEHVSVNYSITDGSLNDLLFTMNLSKADGSQYDKTIRLLRPTSCSADGEGACDIQSTLNVDYAGTVGFMGDTLGAQSQFKFDVSQPDRIQLNSIKIFGHD